MYLYGKQVLCLEAPWEGVVDIMKQHQKHWIHMGESPVYLESGMGKSHRYYITRWDVLNIQKYNMLLGKYLVICEVPYSVLGTYVWSFLISYLRFLSIKFMYRHAYIIHAHMP